MLENEFLLASKVKADEAASDLRERLQRGEMKMAQICASGNLEASNCNQGMIAAKNAALAAMMMNNSPAEAGPRAFGGLQGLGATSRVPPLPGRGGGGAHSAVPLPISAEQGRGQTGQSPNTQAEMAVRRLNGRLEHSFSEIGSGGDARRTRRRGRGRLAATATVVWELRATRGRAAELASLLAATENERDSLAALLALAERKMERMAVTHEELALKLAWESASSWQRWLTRQPPSSDIVGGVATNGAGGMVVKQEEVVATSSTKNTEHPASIKEGTVLPTISSGSAEEIAAATACRAAIETMELRRRVRDLEMSKKLIEAGARELKEENRKLKQYWSSSTCWGAPSPTAEPVNSQFFTDGRTGLDGEKNGRGHSRTGNDADRAIDAEFEHPTSWFQLQGGSSSLQLLSLSGKDSDETRAGTARSVSEIRTPTIDWNSEHRPEGRRRPRLSPFGQEGGQIFPKLPLPQDSEQQQHPLTTLEYGTDGLIKGQLAWVLGLPVSTTTEHELLAEVMHLVVERGTARTDAAALEAQLAEMDAQSLSVTRLATVVAADVSTTTTQGGQSHHTLAGGGPIGGSGGGGSHVASGGSGDLGTYSLVSSLSYDGDERLHAVTGHSSHCKNGGGGRETGGVEDRRSIAEKTTKGIAAAPRTVGKTEEGQGGRGGGTYSHEHGGRDFSGAKQSSDHPRANSNPADRPASHLAEGATGSRAATKAAAPGQNKSKDDPEPAAGQCTVTGKSKCIEAAGLAAKPMAAAAAATPPAAIASTGTTATMVPAVKGVNGNCSRASFPRTLQGRTVSIDIFCIEVEWARSRGGVDLLHSTRE